MIACEGGTSIQVRAAPVFFTVADLRATQHLAKLGPPKSASEGAERDLTWSSVVPLADGKVIEVTPDKVRTQLSTGRVQSYQLKGRTAFVQAGDRFIGKASILAAAVSRIVDPRSLLTRQWSPVEDLTSHATTDRYAAAKALGSGKANSPGNVTALLSKARADEPEPRTALEIAGALARLGIDEGFEFLSSAVERESDDFPPYLRMEAVLILSEISDERAATALDNVAGNAAFKGNELRQAAVWGLGRSGTRSYAKVVKYLADEEDDVALHAIAGLGGDADMAVIESLATMLIQPGETRARVAASEALRMIGSDLVAAALIQRAGTGSPWVAATLGRLPKPVLEAANVPAPLVHLIEPIALLSDSNSWLAERSTATDFQFLLQQVL